MYKKKALCLFFTNLVTRAKLRRKKKLIANILSTGEFTRGGKSLSLTHDFFSLSSSGKAFFAFEACFSRPAEQLRSAASASAGLGAASGREGGSNNAKARRRSLSIQTSEGRKKRSPFFAGPTQADKPMTDFLCSLVHTNYVICISEQPREMRDRRHKDQIAAPLGGQFVPRIHRRSNSPSRPQRRRSRRKGHFELIDALQTA